MTCTFASLGLPPALVAALADAGLTEPFPIQELTIPDALAGRDVCGKAKTGSGKTLAFGLSALVLTPRSEPGRPAALVLVPTRELAVQVADVLEPLGRAVDRRVAVVYGGQRLDRQAAELRSGADLVVATPGRLIDLLERGAVSLGDVRLVILDEADRMVDMGFLPQVQWLLRRVEGPHQTLLFSATLDGAVAHLVANQLREPVQHEVASTMVTVEAMAHRFLLVHEMDKARVLGAIARHHQRTLAFVSSKRGADRLVGELHRLGLRAAALHGDRLQRHREEALRDFAAGSLDVLVATNVAARGLDVEGIGAVVHYDPPADARDYLHRSGRTARAGSSGVVATLLLWNEEIAVRRLRRQLRLEEPIVEVFSNDPRLTDLDRWDPAEAVAG